MAPLARATAVAAARFVALLFGGLYAGFLLAVLVLEATLRGATAEVYVVVQQVKHADLDLLAAATITPAIAGAALLLPLVGPRRRGPFALGAAGLLCLLAALATTLLVNVPINAAQMGWSPQAPPADWAAVRDRWQAAHALRTAAAVLALGCQLLAALRWPEPLAPPATGHASA